MIDIHEYTRQHMVEQVMARHGCGSPDPVTYRRVLNRMGLPALRRALNEAPDFPHVNIATVEPVLTGAENEDRTHEDFPAVSLTENAGVIASADKGTVPGSSRGIFSRALTLKSVLV